MKLKHSVKIILEYFGHEYLRALNPEEYPVDLSQKCWDNKMKNINEARINVEKMITK